MSETLTREPAHAGYADGSTELWPLPLGAGVQGDVEASASPGPDEPTGLMVMLRTELARSCPPPAVFSMMVQHEEAHIL